MTTMIDAIQTGFTINIGRKSYTVINIDDNSSRPNTRAAFDKAGIRDRLALQNGSKVYTVVRYNNGTLGDVVKC